MQKLVAALAVASIAAAQSPLTTLTGGTNQGNTGNNIFFDLTVNSTITITQIDFLCGANTVAGTGGGLEILLGPTSYVGNTLNSALWTPVVTLNNLTVAPSTMTNAMLPTPFALGPGNYGVALRSIACNHGYTNGVTCTSTTVPGSCSNSLFSTAELTLRAGANQNTPWITGLNQPRIFNGAIHYTPGGTPIAVASWQTFGPGCYANYHSIYERYLNPSTSYDLGNANGTNALRFTFTGTGYVVGPFQNGTGTFFTPTGAATNLALGDDQELNVALPFQVPFPTPNGPLVASAVDVSSNGCVSPNGPNGVGAAPTNTLFLAGNARWANWYDFDPSTGGQVNTEIDPGNGSFVISWIGVPDFNVVGSSNTWQIALFNTGDVEMRWQAMSHATGGVQQAMVGWTPGGLGLLDPLDTDLSAIAAPGYQLGPIERHALTLGMSARPVLGTNPNFETSNIAPNTILSATLFGFGNFVPPFDLTGFQMPGCFGNVDFFNAFTGPLVIGPVGQTSQAFPIPMSVSYNGVLVYAQSASLTPGINTGGVATSNGVRMLVGSL